MTSRRQFLKQTGIFAGAVGGLSSSIRRAFSIDPAPGSKWTDAEHVVILMQENRSFDHLYGSLRGVRGYDDPRAIQLPNGNRVWLQTNKEGETFAPYRFDIRETKITWLGSLPHTWADQTRARNGGKHDGWLDAKKSGRKECAGMPLTLGAYSRADIPFYYDVADAFTVCDQHFCSSLTGTMPNRLFLWSGTNRGSRDGSAAARVNNGEIEYENSCRWKTFPDRLETLGVSWKVYQNEISAVDVGLHQEAELWLSNYGDNPLEWFPQFHVGYVPNHRKRLAELMSSLPTEIEKLEGALQATPDSLDLAKRLRAAKAALRNAKSRYARFTPERFEKLSAYEKSLHAKGLSTNVGDPDYRTLKVLQYLDDGVQREMKIPKGDILHQFRQDVATGQLPVVSWIVAPEKFSDHPSSPWYGAWYVSEVMNILTQNPAVWRKTILLLTYDENDGYFDHVPPFVAPHPGKAETGITAKGLSAEGDFVTMEEELKSKRWKNPHESSIGLGFRVPLVIASPWTRGGYVCSQVFDHTSSLQFLEKLLSQKLGKSVHEPNISDWRRAVCGDLTSAFRSYDGEKIGLPPFLQKEPFVEGIHKAQFKPAPTGFKSFSEPEIQEINEHQRSRYWKLRQEPGTRPSCSLPYELVVDGQMNAETKQFDLSFSARNNRFGKIAAGAAFNVYAPGNHKSLADKESWEKCRVWNFGLSAGASLQYSWRPQDFEDEIVFLRIYGPNGFFREFRTNANAPVVARCDYQGDFEILLSLVNTDPSSEHEVEIVDNAYGASRRMENLRTGRELTLKIDARSSSGWYDFSVRLPHSPIFVARFAGRVENGKESISDPVIGRT